MINNVVLQGRITETPELRTISTGSNLVTFSLAVARSYVKAGTERQTDFIECIAWNKTADFIARNFSKGQMMGVTGHLQTETYTDREGKNRKRVEVYVDKVDFMDSKKEEKPTADVPFFPTFEGVEESASEIADASLDLPF